LNLHRPTIGITTDRDILLYPMPGDRRHEFVSVPSSYVESIIEAGGVPLLLPPCVERGMAERYVDMVDGLLFSGGFDLDPSYFGQEPHPRLGHVGPVRDAAEMELARCALERDKPILAICRGLQVLCAAAGGNLWQDLRLCDHEVVQHRQDAPRWHASHRVKMEPGSQLAGILETTQLRTNSFHHQAVREVGTGLRAVAWSDDGLVEAVEGTAYRFVIGVQWHPECMWSHHPPQLALFRALVRAAGGEGADR